MKIHISKLGRMVEYAKKLGGNVDVQVKLPGVELTKSTRYSHIEKHVL